MVGSLPVSASLGGHGPTSLGGQALSFFWETERFSDPSHCKPGGKKVQYCLLPALRQAPCLFPGFTIPICHHFAGSALVAPASSGATSTGGCGGRLRCTYCTKNENVEPYCITVTGRTLLINVTVLSSALEAQLLVILVARFHHLQEAVQLLPLGRSLYCYIAPLLLQLLHPQILLVLLLSLLVMRSHLMRLLPQIHNHGLVCYFPYDF